MSRHGKRDVLIHFDEVKNEIIFFTVAEDVTSNIRATEFDGARVDTQFFKEITPEEAERNLGQTVFSLIDSFSNNKIGIRDYETLNELRHQQDVAAWQAAASAGDPEAQHMMFIEHHSKALFNSDPEALAKAEEMLQLAAASGHEQAIFTLENHWSLMRAAVERKIMRRPTA